MVVKACVVLKPGHTGDETMVKALQDHAITPLVAIARTMDHRPYDFRPPPGEPGGPKIKEPKPIKAPWRIAMQAELNTPNGKALYAKRQQTVEPVFGIIKSAIGLTRFRLRGLAKVSAEWTMIALAYNCRSLHRLRLA
jgi:hypothetical protein